MSELIRWQDKDLTEYYEADEVDAVIAELKAKLDKTTAERDGNQVCIDALKTELEDVKATAYAESVDAGMRDRRLKRALWLSRVLRARDRAFECYLKNNVEMCDKWDNIHSMLMAKAEEYK